ncbi:MAG: metal-sensing transcriptional repressor [Candidatus Peribacteraceae bacterium]
MLPTQKKKALEALKRLDGLSAKVKTMMNEDAYCPHVLENLLAMHGHIKHIQNQVLNSHLHTCAEQKMKSRTSYDAFIEEIARSIGLSRRS